MGKYVIETFSLSKTFPGKGAGSWSVKAVPPVVAVDQVNLAVQQGELFGVLGPNGAGKTTFLKMLATLITPSSGTAWVNGHDLTDGQAIRNCLSLVDNEGRSFFWRLSARQNLEFFAALYHLPHAGLRRKIEEVLHLVGLEDVAAQPVYAFSSGMKQRLAQARGLLRKTPIILLDEPTRGLDPVSTRQIHRLLRHELVERQGVTLLLSTNQLWEAEALCHRIAVLHQGRLQGCGSLPELQKDLRPREPWRLVIKHLKPELQKIDGISSGSSDNPSG